MNVREWSKSTAVYGQKLVHSGREGAALGRDSYLHGEHLGTFFNQSARTALKPAVLGAALGLLSAYPAHRNRSALRAFECGVLGCVVGFGAAVAWQSRGLASSVASRALKNIDRVRDEHWLEKHPIDYA
ncbi:MAG: hypothetical protein LAN64_16090 [Acidobacteriia bacterium]|nr:hypothetical protein [Terriglobia bacterium]